MPSGICEEGPSRVCRSELNGRALARLGRPQLGVLNPALLVVAQSPVLAPGVVSALADAHPAWRSTAKRSLPRHAAWLRIAERHPVASTSKRRATGIAVLATPLMSALCRHEPGPWLPPGGWDGAERAEPP